MAAADPIKVYDARWRVEEFDDSAVRRLFEAAFLYGRELSVDTVTVTRDGRLGAAHVQELAIETAVKMGLRVFSCPDPISTPCSYFTTLKTSQQYPRTMGVTITASHSPKECVGAKFTMPVVQAIGLDCGPKGGLTRIREIYHSKQKAPAVAGGSRTDVNCTADYLDYSMKQANLHAGQLAGLSVVLDGFNGSAGPELAEALKLAGVKVEPLRLEVDGNFPTGSPDPVGQGKMDNAVRVADQKGCQVVIGTDGDGDRLAFGDRRGTLSAGFVAIPILRACGFDGELLGRPAVLYDPKINPRALAEWGKLDVRPVLFRNGNAQIKDHMRTTGAMIATEESGRYYHNLTMGTDVVAVENSALTSLLFLAQVKQDPGLLDRLWSLQETVHTTGEFNYRFAGDDVRDQALNAVIRHFSGQGAATATTTPDGIDLLGTVLNHGITGNGEGIHLKNGWFSGYLRIATNERGVVRSYFSAAEAGRLKQIESETRRILAEQFKGQVID